MGYGTLALLACSLLSVLALACSLFAARRSTLAATSRQVAALLEETRAEGVSWKGAAMALKRQVEDELDRVESKRRSVAGVEARLRLANSADEIESAGQGPDPSAPDPSVMTRAELRASRRNGAAG